MSAPFSHEWLRALLAGAPVVRLGDWDGGPGLILRHDVDLSLAAAHDLARREHDWGVAATVCVRVDGPHYNVLAPRTRARLRDLVAWGCEVGLHFDVSLGGDLDARAREEADVLALASGAPVRSLSLHNPSVTGDYPLIAGFVNAYDPRIFGPGAYVSDSRMELGGDAGALVAAARTRPAQLLLHPEHFGVGGYREVMDRYLAGVHAELLEEYVPNPAALAALRDILCAG